MTSWDPTRIDRLLGNGVAAIALRRMEHDRSAWMRAIAQTHSLAEQLNKVAGEGSLAVQMLKQIQESEMVQQERIRKMLDPLADIRKILLIDSNSRRMLEEFSRPALVSDRMSELVDQAMGSRAFLTAMQLDIEKSVESTRKLLADSSVSSGLHQLIKGFEDANWRWTVPAPLLESLGPLKALQEQIGKLSLPVMDVASAAALATLLGPEGIRAQLDALGIHPDGSVSADFAQQDEGIGLSRKALELMALLGFILTVLIPLYQEYSSAQWQAATDGKLEAQRDALADQGRRIDALTKLVENALVKEAKRREERFVVLDRVTMVRSEPEDGSSVVGKLLPREVVRPLSEKGKWIEFEYYHWLRQEYRTGWALKKYFQRVPSNPKVQEP